MENGLGNNYLFSIYHFSLASEETKGRILEFFAPDLDKEGQEFKRYFICSFVDRACTACNTRHDLSHLKCCFPLNCHSTTADRFFVWAQVCNGSAMVHHHTHV